MVEDATPEAFAVSPHSPSTLPADDFDARCREAAPALFAWAELRIRPPLRGRIDAQDLVQEVWLRALKRRESFDPASASFRAWILTIAKNVLMESLRKLRSLRRLEADFGPTSRLFALDGCPESITSFTQRLSKDDALQRFLELTQALDPDDRQILARCGLEERTCAEVARELELGEAAVIKRWQRMRARLREEAWVAEILQPWSPRRPPC
jgi:RNA polymerase sigma-70 factor (ECF subfamily)